MQQVGLHVCATCVAIDADVQDWYNRVHAAGWENYKGLVRKRGGQYPKLASKGPYGLEIARRFQGMIS